MAKINSVSNPRIRKPRKASSSHYVDDNKLYLAIKDYKERCAKAEEEGKPLPIMPDYIGVAALKISENVANKYSYRGYAYKEEMILDGVLFCIKSVSSFDVVKYQKPFVYFTTAVQFAFWQRIEREKKYQYTKLKMLDKASIFDEMYEGDSHNSTNADMPYSENSIANMHHFIKEYEESMAKKKQKNIDKKLMSDFEESELEDD